MRRNRLASRLLVADAFQKIMRYLHGVKKLPRGTGIALLTSQNPRQNLPNTPEGQQPPREVSTKENEALYRDLLQTLKREGLAYWKMGGNYGKPEKSVAVVGITPEKATELGRLYDQESVIWSGIQDGHMVHKMLYSHSEVDAAPPVVDKQMWIKNMKDAEDYFSKVDDRKFSIPFFSDEGETQPLPKKVTEKFKPEQNVQP